MARRSPIPASRQTSRSAYRKHRRCAEVTLGNLDGARGHFDYRQAQAILRRLTRRSGAAAIARMAARPRHGPHDQIGDVLRTPATCRRAWRRDRGKSLNVKRELADADPEDAHAASATSPYPTTRSATCCTMAGSQDDALKSPSSAQPRHPQRACARQCPTIAERQRDLSVSRDKIGDVLRDKGDAQARAESLYRRGATSCSRLAARDRQDIELQRDLSVSRRRRSATCCATEAISMRALAPFQQEPRHHRGAGGASIPRTRIGSATSSVSTGEGARDVLTARATSARHLPATKRASRSCARLSDARRDQCRLAARSVDHARPGRQSAHRGRGLRGRARCAGREPRHPRAACGDAAGQCAAGSVDLVDRLCRLRTGRHRDPEKRAAGPASPMATSSRRTGACTDEARA